MDSPGFDPLDTTNCEAEPICYPGSVQPHGVVLVLDPGSALIAAASESCTALMSVSAEKLLGQSLTSVFGPAASNALLGGDCGKLQPLFSLILDGLPFTARSQRNACGQLLIDIEPGPTRTGSVEQLSYNIRSGLEALRRLRRSTEVCEAAARLIGQLTGFDQVMIYRFDAHWNGEIIAEAVAPGIEPYLGLHFPASDIPQQARELFKVCRVRLIADVHYRPSALLSRGDAPAVDLGLSSLRSVSPLHIQYLKNMGARATLVCALVIKDRLWGLVSCQQKIEPRFFSPAERDALGWLCQDISALLEARLQSEHSELEHSLALRRRRLIDAVRSLEFGELMRANNNADLLAVMGSDGFALIVDQTIQATGATPSLERIRQLNQSRLQQHPGAEPYASHALVPDLGPGPGDAGVAGALFVTVLRQPVVTMIWFRRERRHTLTWGGDPSRPHLVDASGCLTPRTSFQQYLQEVSGQSWEWLPEELQSAGELVALVEIEALRNSEAFSRTILNSMTEHVFVLDENGVIVSVNDAWKRFAADNGAPQLSLHAPGMSYRDIRAAAPGQPGGGEADSAWAGIDAVLKRHADSFSLDYPCDSPNQKRWFRMQVYPVRAPANGAIVAHEDITPRKQAELARDRSEAHWKALVSNDLCGIMLSQNRKIVWANPAFEKMFGYGTGELAGTDRRQGYPSEAAWQAFDAAAYAQLAQGKIYRTETEYVRRDGGHIWVDVSGAVLDAADGTSLWSFVDITDHKRATDRLRESEQRFRTLVSHNNAIILQIDAASGQIIEANTAACKFYGWSRAQLCASLIQDINQLSADQIALERQAALTQQRNYFIFPHRLANGDIRTVEVHSSPIDIGGRAVLISIIHDVTDRVNGEKRIDQLMHEQKAILDSRLVGIVKVRDRDFKWSNDVFAEMLGYAPAELIDSPTRMIHPSDQSFGDFGQAAYACMNSGGVFRTEVQYLRKDGTLGWYDISGGLLYPGSEESIWTLVGISDRRRVEQMLREREQALRWSEERLRSMFSTMVEGVVFQDKDGKIVDANAAAEAMFRLSHDQLLGKTSMDHDWHAIYENGSAFPGDKHPAMVTLRTGQPQRNQIMGIVRKPGETRWISINSQPVLLPGKSLPEAVVTSFIDITERKAAEMERKRLAKIIEDAPDFIAMTDMQSNLRYLNAAGARMVGLAANVDLSPLQIKDMHPEWATQRVLYEAVPAVLRTGLWQGETALLHRDGHETPVSQMLLLHRDEAGKPQYLSTIMRDISLLKTREKELEVAGLAAEQANIAKSRFLATMSHEIRTPMNGILGMAQLLLGDELGERSRRDYARTILASGQTLLMLLNDILDLSKIEAGKVQLEQLVFDPAALLQEIRSLFAGAAQAKGLQLGCKWRGTAQSRYVADAYRIRQMLSNLAGNALKFTAQGSVHLDAIELEQMPDAVMLEFSVTDTGIGIPADKIDLLFKPFSQTDSSTTREYGGTGLGLSIVSNLARAMGGSVGIDSLPGKGSRFWFRLLARRVEPDDESRSEERANPDHALAAASTIRPDGRALVAEDNAVNCQVIESLLASIGVASTLVNDGQQAVNAIRNGDRPDLVLMDLHMPVMDGYTATQLIRQWEQDRKAERLPIIALTADAFAEDRQHCMDVGMDDFLTKPIDIAALKQALLKWMPARLSPPPGAGAATLQHQPLDMAHFQKLVTQLKPMLAEDLFEAIEYFKDLEVLAAGTGIAAEIDDMLPAMESLRFDLVLQRLNSLTERLLQSPS